eukprot:2584046-Amphidinium_carterae.1
MCIRDRPRLALGTSLVTSTSNRSAKRVGCLSRLAGVGNQTTEGVPPGVEFHTTTQSSCHGHAEDSSECSNLYCKPLEVTRRVLAPTATALRGRAS